MCETYFDRFLHQSCPFGLFVPLQRVHSAGWTLHLLFSLALKNNTSRMQGFFFALEFFAAWLFTFCTVRNVLSSP